MFDINSPKFAKYSSLFSACLCTSSSGVVYAFSLYSPQLSDHLKFDSFRINFIGASGHVGLFAGSLVFGYLSTIMQSTKLLALSSLLFFVGFCCLSNLYSQLNENYILYSISYLMVGLASSISTIIPLAITSHNFKGEQGFAIGLPLVFFGSSGLIYSFVYRSFFVFNKIIDLKNFFLFLSVTTTLLTSNSLFLLRKVNTDPIPSEQECLLQVEPKELKGLEFIKQKKAQVLFLITMGISGTGLMYGNNVGEMLHLLNSNHETNLPHLQGLNVSIFSVSNTIGRIFVTFSSDFLRNKFNVSRVNYLKGSSILMIIAQLIVMLSYTTTLYSCSAIIGFSFGMFFATAPAMISEWFGSKHFSYNWGIMSLSPAIGSELANQMFAYIYDSHSKFENGGYTCNEGSNCYFYSFVNTSLICLLCLVATLFIRSSESS